MTNLLIAVFFSLSVVASPKDVEVWFLSNSKTAFLNEILNPAGVLFGPPTAELQCQEMGDYCFDPQYGLYKKNDSGPELVNAEKLDHAVPTIPSGKSIDRDLLNCDPKNYFDVFCGRAKSSRPVNTSLELWIDTSSSMKEFDYSDKEGGCHRKSFIRRLDETCGFNQKFNVMVFDTALKEAGTMEQVCDNRGLNDSKRLIDWIKRSEAKKLIVITDINEFHKEFSDYIESINGRLRGDNVPLTGSDLVALAGELAKSCK